MRNFRNKRKKSEKNLDWHRFDEKLHLSQQSIGSKVFDFKFKWFDFNKTWLDDMACTEMLFVEMTFRIECLTQTGSSTYGWLLFGRVYICMKRKMCKYRSHWHQTTAIYANCRPSSGNDMHTLSIVQGKLLWLCPHSLTRLRCHCQSTKECNFHGPKRKHRTEHCQPGPLLWTNVHTKCSHRHEYHLIVLVDAHFFSIPLPIECSRLSSTHTLRAHTTPQNHINAWILFTQGCEVERLFAP